jgi:hypothetical protein
VVDASSEQPIKSLNDPIENKEFFKYPLISCELLICDIQLINDSLIGNARIMDKLYDYLRQEQINPILTSYFVKIVGSLISKNVEKFLTFIQAKEDFLALFLKHMNTSSIIDIIRLLVTIQTNSSVYSTYGGISNVDTNTAILAQNAIRWLKDINLIDRLVDMFKPPVDDTASAATATAEADPTAVYSNVSQLLSDLVKITREQIFNVLENTNVNSCFGGSNSCENTNDQFGSIDDDSLGANRVNETITIENNKHTISSLLKNSILEQIEK